MIDPTSPFWRRSAMGFLWKEWCWSWSSSTLATWCEELIIGKNSDVGRDWGQEEKGTTEDEMAGWHHWLDGCEFGWTLGAGDEQGGLACCNSWGRKGLDTTEWLNWTELNWCRQSNHMWITAVIFLDNLRLFFLILSTGGDSDMMFPRRYFWIFYKTSSFVSLLLHLKKNILYCFLPLSLLFPSF